MATRPRTCDDLLAHLNAPIFTSHNMAYIGHTSGCQKTPLISSKNSQPKTVPISIRRKRALFFDKRALHRIEAEVVLLPRPTRD